VSPRNSTTPCCPEATLRSTVPHSNSASLDVYPVSLAPHPRNPALKTKKELSCDIDF
jgi:hypothetical protein